MYGGWEDGVLVPMKDLALVSDFLGGDEGLRWKEMRVESKGVDGRRMRLPRVHNLSP